jgi:hypothetical protein
MLREDVLRDIVMQFLSCKVLCSLKETSREEKLHFLCSHMQHMSQIDEKRLVSGYREQRIQGPETTQLNVLGASKSKNEEPRYYSIE